MQWLMEPMPRANFTGVGFMLGFLYADQYQILKLAGDDHPPDDIDTECRFDRDRVYPVERTEAAMRYVGPLKYALDPFGPRDLG